MSDIERYTPASSMYRILEGDYPDDAYVTFEDYETLQKRLELLEEIIRKENPDVTFAQTDWGYAWVTWEDDYKRYKLDSAE